MDLKKAEIPGHVIEDKQARAATARDSDELWHGLAEPDSISSRRSLSFMPANTNGTQGTDCDQ